ncbi:hypothetical protein EG68_10681 [Paragonimus skrjabini miyazakii]|uniref:Deleted in lung and esophageal cancer protein 1 Ig-like domain-containing protein n=1 Tax=Paragonimus skrjabini miyazakii TaxID=59628 RepID=A0A8S9YCJ6_9TREM|nr:hypothetical protein EG68_10681 [Paragonimus skrjabini miyazakii]
MSDEPNVSHRQKTSQIYSQDISHSFLSIFKDKYQTCPLDNSTSTFLDISKNSDESTHRDYINAIDEINSAYLKELDKSAFLEKCVLELSKQRSEQSPKNDIINVGTKNAVGGTLVETDSIFQNNGLLCTDDIFFNGRKLNKMRAKLTESSDRDKTCQSNKYEQLTRRRKTLASSQAETNFKANLDEQYEVSEEIRKLQFRMNFQKNPRFSEKPSRLTEGKSLFEIEPKEVVFTSYESGKQCELKIRVRNTSQLSRSLRILPPKTVYFCLAKVDFPQGTRSTVAPGMAVHLTVYFRPDTLGRFEDEIVVEYEAQLKPLIVPLIAQRLQPEINLPAQFNLGRCIVGSTKMIRAQMRNKNSNQTGRFRFIFMGQATYEQYETCGLIEFDNFWSTAELSKSLDTKNFLIVPACFRLDSLESIDLDISFSPLSTGCHTVPLALVCDDGSTRWSSLEGKKLEFTVSIVPRICFPLIVIRRDASWLF